MNIKKQIDILKKFKGNIDHLVEIGELSHNSDYIDFFIRVGVMFYHFKKEKINEKIKEKFNYNNEEISDIYFFLIEGISSMHSFILFGIKNILKKIHLEKYNFEFPNEFNTVLNSIEGFYFMFKEFGNYKEDSIGSINDYFKDFFKILKIFNKKIQILKKKI